ncbi:MAG: hypothetical protein IJ787_07205 [Bacilli bacterium]|nr:hypothetical protein [Bacilli bacterium]
MSGQEQAYREFIKKHPCPPNINDYQERAYDYLGMIRYAKSKGISAAELSPEEKKRFLIKP